MYIWYIYVYYVCILHIYIYIYIYINISSNTIVRPAPLPPSLYPRSRGALEPATMTLSAQSTIPLKMK